MRAKNSIDFYQELKSISYNDYVKAKGFFLLRLEGLKEEHNIVKRGEILILGEEKHNIKDITISDFIVLIKEYDDTIAFKITSEIEKEALNKISALFIADFNSVKIIEKPIIVSPIKKSWVSEYTDVFNSKHSLSSFEVFSTLTKNQQQTTETDNEYIVYNTQTEVKAIIEYRATELNVYCLHEIPAYQVGAEGLVQMGVFSDN